MSALNIPAVDYIRYHRGREHLASRLQICHQVTFTFTLKSIECSLHDSVHLFNQSMPGAPDTSEIISSNILI